MCGFVGAFNITADTDNMRERVITMSRKIRHRGPDWSGVYASNNCILAHERLAIVDPFSGKQPLKSPDGKISLAVNGEIYNHLEIREKYADSYEFQTMSDCEVILALYKDKGTDIFEEINGIYAFALYDSEKDLFFIGRDHIGIIPLYQGWDKEGQYYVASELKALEGICAAFEEFPPGSYFISGEKEPVRWYSRPWESFDAVKDNTTDISAVRKSLESAVKRQMMSDVPFGVLLSGGLDSSIIAAVMMKFAKNRVESKDQQEAWWPRLHSFAIGLKGSPDLAAARIAADFIGTVHHEVHFTIQEALDALPDVVYHLETYDITTIRASTPMFLLAKVIKSMGIKMVLSGEGSDELFGGYLYFAKAPSAKDFHEETVRKLSKLHLYDCLRANKSLMSWGVEGRVPFLDFEFIDTAMTQNPKDKMSSNDPKNIRIEKHILRQAFEDLLPKEIAWRQKEQFSDGVGYSWIDTLKEMTEQKVSDQMFENAHHRFPTNTPLNKEEYYYRSLFEDAFPSESAARCVPHEASVACSTQTALEWDEAFKQMNDPSGRAVAGVHEQAYSKK
ncbi:MAG: asparagine synthase B [Sphaerochaetaceae bacterium]|nr:asparagine synthase B [Sphaerochaetaceae bacterium]